MPQGWVPAGTCAVIRPVAGSRRYTRLPEMSATHTDPAAPSTAQGRPRSPTSLSQRGPAGFSPAPAAPAVPLGPGVPPDPVAAGLACPLGAEPGPERAPDP